MQLFVDQSTAWAAHSLALQTRLFAAILMWNFFFCRIWTRKQTTMLALWAINKRAMKVWQRRILHTFRPKEISLHANKYEKEIITVLSRTMKDDGVVDFTHLANLYLSFDDHSVRK